MFTEYFYSLPTFLIPRCLFRITKYNAKYMLVLWNIGLVISKINFEVQEKYELLLEIYNDIFNYNS